MDKPIINSYCVIPNLVYAGEYAGDLVNPQQKVRQLEAFGIKHFIDLTEKGELKPYAHLLNTFSVHIQFEIRDRGVPLGYDKLYDLFVKIEHRIRAGNKVYIHCWGGVGRTGTVVACLYEYFGEDFETAVRHLRESFMECPKSQWRHTPENINQLNYIRDFGAYLKCIGHKNRMPIYTPENITSLKPNEIFVFGSNLAGHHGSGAARVARLRFGAIMGRGVGPQGQSYAIPTMQGGVETIKPYVDQFIAYARMNKQLRFYVTRIGCGIAGFKDEQIATLFDAAYDLPNVVLPKRFCEIINQARRYASEMSGLVFKIVHPKK